MTATAQARADDMNRRSPTALQFLKHSFNADTDHLAGMSHLAFDGLELFGRTEGAAEGAAVFAATREPDFRRFRSWWRSRLPRR